MKVNVLGLIGTAIGLTGYILVWQFSDGLVAVGVLCAIWGNNIERKAG